MGDIISLLFFKNCILNHLQKSSSYMLGIKIEKTADLKKAVLHNELYTQVLQ